MELLRTLGARICVPHRQEHGHIFGVAGAFCLAAYAAVCKLQKDDI